MTECIEWTGAKLPSGYGKWRGTTAHRVVREQENGPIGDPDMVVHHACYNRSCINIEHLQLVTRSENASWQRSWFAPTCSKGHPFDDSNTYWFKPEHSRKYGGRRRCRACDAERHRKRRAAAAVVA